MKQLLFVLLLVTTMATVAQADTYQWTDREGTVHFTDSPGNVPAEHRKDIKPGNKETPTTGGSPSGNASAGDRPALGLELSPGADGRASIAPRVEGLQQRMMNDEGIMALIGTLQNDPEMQALLKDPAVLRAVQSGDIGTLLNNPAFMRLLDNPRVREIGKKLDVPGTAKQ